MPELCCAVALAQTENIDLLVSRRQEVASILCRFHNLVIYSPTD